MLMSPLSNTGTCKYNGLESGNGVSGSSGAAFITQVTPNFSKKHGIATPAPHRYNDGTISEMPGSRSLVCILKIQEEK